MRKRLICKLVKPAIILLMCLIVMIPVSAGEEPAASDSVTVNLTSEEQKYIENNPEVSIAIDTSWIPYGFEGKDGQCEGIIPNVLSIVAERVGLEVQFEGKPTYIEAITACNTGETDLVSGIADDSKMSDKNDLYRTSPYITIGYSAITKRTISDIYAKGASYKVALCVGTYAKMAMQERMPDYEFVEYHSNEECMKAVEAGKADIALIANYAAGYYSSWHEFKNLQTVQINDFTWGLCFGVNKDCDPMLIQILNKGIASLTENDVNQACYGGAIKAYSSDKRLSDFIYNHPVFAAVIVGIIVALITLYVMLIILQRRKNAERERERLYEENIHRKDKLLNSLPAGIGIFEIVDGKPYMRFINDSFYTMLGDSKYDRIIGNDEDFMNGIFEEDRNVILQNVTEIINGKEEADYDCRVIKTDRSTIWIHVSASVTERNEDTITVYCSFTDVDEEVNSRQKLQESADIINAAMKSANMSVWSYDIAKRQIVQRDDSAIQNGYSKVIDNIPDSLIESGYVHPDSAKEYQEAFNRLAEATEPIQGDYYVGGINGANYWWERMILTPVFENGILTKAVGTSINISDRKEKESQYLKLIDNMSDANEDDLIAKGRYNLNTNKCTYYKRKSDEGLSIILDNSFDEAVDMLLETAEHKKDKDLIIHILNRHNMIEEYGKGKKEGSFEYKRLPKEGSYIWTLVKYSIYEEPYSGELILFIYSYDISERVLENKMLTRLGQAEYDALCLVDMHTRRYIIKNIVGKIEGAQFPMEGSYEEVVKLRLDSIAIPEEKNTLLEQFSLDKIIDELEKKDKYVVLYSVCDTEGKLFRKKFQFCYLDDLRTIILCFRMDVTEVYNREQQQLLKTEDALLQARKASEAKTEFFSRMSHDMRTPMNGILGLARLAADDSDENRLKDSLKKIEESGEYLLGLINDTLDFQKIENGRLVLEPQPVFTREVITNVISMVKPSADQKGIDFQIKYINADIDSYVNIDPMRMKQIFMNLISNAIKFTPDGGTIDVVFECTGRDNNIAHDVITITDTGIGMSEDFIKNGIFKPFSQEYNEITSTNAGTGLGLSIVKKLVELMKGTIEVESELGVGT